MPDLKTIVIYTTRPIREGEQEGVEYYFVDEKRLAEFEATRESNRNFAHTIRYTE